MYLTLKLLHIFGVVLFLGNIITAVLWKSLADRSNDARVIAYAMEGIIAADRYFTVPGVGLILVTGISLVITSGYSFLGTTWVWQSLVLFAISGIVFMGFLTPLQRRLRDVAVQGGRGGFDRVTYQRLSRQWAIWGSLATLAPLAALGLMVLKPTY
ncbi:MAG TPA: DUF2269 family protein [Steroidobacteraceae bacterium]|nr:DUF2269 family protein [Steroidobacteraceae bacterium]